MGWIGRTAVVAVLSAASCGNAPPPTAAPTTTAPPTTAAPTTTVSPTTTSPPTMTIPPTTTSPPTTTIPATTTTPVCPDPLLTVLPIDEAAIGAVVPLGNLNPPGHTQPTDHVYFWLAGHEDGWPSEETPLLAPSDGTITRVGHMTGTTAQGQFADWSLAIEVCDGHEVRFGHVATLTPEIEAALTGQRRCHEYGYDGEWYEYCDISTSTPVVAGDVIGTAGGNGTLSIALDLWAVDWTAEPAFFVNQEAIHDDMRYAVCPLDWFEPDLRDLLYAATESATRVPLAESVGCGAVAQDVAGTAKGLWYLAGGAEGEWQDQLALVDDNHRIVDQAISVASVPEGPGVWLFERRHDGRVNRDFAEVTAGSGLWCYDDFADRTGRFVLEVVDETTLHIEHQAGQCGQTLRLDEPVAFRR